MTAAAADDAQETLRLFFEMTRDDNPRLYDDLVRFKKGTKRVNRLRLLAHEGLMAQHWQVLQGGAAPALRPDAGAGVSPSAARHTNQAFDVPSGTDS